MSEETAVFTGQIPPQRYFRVSRNLSPAVDIVVAAHMMTISEEAEALIFYTYRVEQLQEQTIAVQYCTRIFAAGMWLEAEEIDVPALTGTKH